MLQTHICLSVHCGQYGRQPKELEFEGHRPTAAAALDAVLADGWQIEPGGHLLCPACRAVLAAELNGISHRPKDAEVAR